MGSLKLKYVYRLFFCVSFCLGLFSCIVKKDQSNTTLEKEKMDWKQFQNDLIYVNDEDSNELPLGFGVFPVLEYDSSGNGSVKENLELCNVKFIQQSVFVYQGDYNKTFFRNVDNLEEELIYFTILIRTTEWNLPTNSLVSSRNHPTYLSQGIVSIDEKRKIKWIASHKDEGNSDIAIVNMKYFDLSKGRLIVVYPMADGSLRFKQISVKQESIDSLRKFIVKNERELSFYEEL